MQLACRLKVECFEQDMAGTFAGGNEAEHLFVDAVPCPHGWLWAVVDAHHYSTIFDRMMWLNLSMRWARNV